jgi:hypothetical protein
MFDRRSQQFHLLSCRGNVYIVSGQYFLAILNTLLALISGVLISEPASRVVNRSELVARSIFGDEIGEFI